VTEADWMGGTEPLPLLRTLGEGPDPRKLRLFACACVRRWQTLFPDPSCRAVLQLSERFAERRASRQHLAQAHNLAVEIERRVRDAWIAQPTHMPAVQVVHALLATTARSAMTAAIETVTAVGQAAVLSGRGERERTALADLVREVFGNPFRSPAFAPDWLRWNGGTVVRLARDIVASRNFADLPVLADALEEAGCADGAVLHHCRSPREHALGCWVLDALLGEA
jgi:hypothetical protein